MEKKLTVIAFIRAQDGRSEALGKRLLALLEPSRKEPGCINYDVHLANDDPNLWCMYENWRSQADLDAHFQTPPLQALVSDLAYLVEGELDMRYFSMKPESAA
ncbi:putative quinol monooxygenase [Pseudomonas syringae]|uniref:Antibiotic biosynthesis monooxygenase n=1 Tax=Pseudomonas syringae TaxID=317 RepID=A0A085V8K9_PSESX|nr:putative quinol monooxygenase [Pseudomonas syringae]KFE51772.1 antibiotic biosynthesis monooxygenase [Pseudomonas syringae]